MLIFELLKLNFQNLTFNLEVVFRIAFKINHKQKNIFNFLIFENYRNEFENRTNREFIAHFPIIRTKCQTETAETG